jgi:dihydrofolate synthase/folylpolyglutamate synthase
MSETYQEALDYLYGLVNFEHRRLDQYAPENFTLERPQRLLAELVDPHLSYPSIHIAGTKGKGSVAAMCAAVLQASGYKVGLYTSPHLLTFRDRIRVLSPTDTDGRISREEVVTLVNELKPLIASEPELTWYEVVTTMGFLHFARQEVDVAVIEVGLGGRLDATNVITPLVSVITSLSLDHTFLLGDTLAEIAAEKGGIIKPGVPVVCSHQVTEALAVLEKMAGAHQADFILIGREWEYEGLGGPRLSEGASPPGKQTIIIRHAPEGALLVPGQSFNLALAGRHQQENAMVALAALDVVSADFPSVTLETIRPGLANVNWPGRLQLLATPAGRPRVLVDCAHNVDSVDKLVDALLHDYSFENLWLIVGITADKDMAGILKRLLPLTTQVIVTSSDHPRAASHEELHGISLNLGFEPATSPAVLDAFTRAWDQAGAGDLICVTGSIFVVANLLNHWETLQSAMTT